MNTAYFPFTYIEESVVKKINSLFNRMIVYQPVSTAVPEMMRQFDQDGRIEIRVPVQGGEDRLIKFCTEFKEWGRLHQSESVSLKTIFNKGFYNTSFAAQISTDILKDSKDEKPDFDPIFLARLFLFMAQDLDIQQSEIDHDLALSIDDELDLFKSMTGEDRVLDISKGSLFDNDPGAYMTGQRVAAWVELMQKDEQAPSFLITTSKTTFNEIIAGAPDFEDVCFYEGISWDQPEPIKKEVERYLMNLAAEPWSGSDHIAQPNFESGDFETRGLGKINFRLCILPEKGPDALTNRSATTDESLNHQQTSLNTLVGLIDDF
ncbi:MAG: hypothetical protein ACKVE4_09935 [Dissulfuribacterales bacterium]